VAAPAQAQGFGPARSAGHGPGPADRLGNGFMGPGPGADGWGPGPGFQVGPAGPARGFGGPWASPAPSSAATGASRWGGSLAGPSPWRGEGGDGGVGRALDAFVRQLVAEGEVRALVGVVGAGHYAAALEREEVRTVRALADASEAQLEACGVWARGARLRILDAARGVRALMDGLADAA
jgi:hypothetical protein